jgi:signal transduction histidine kinase
VKLSQFINEHTAEIVTEWEYFARTQLPAAAVMSELALRNHAAYILKAIAQDIDAEQNLEQQYEKSKGQASITVEGEDSAAAVHGTLRHASGFTLLQLTAEFRALRATVMRLWLPKNNQLGDATINDIVRFNEAIDQALAESVVTYSGRVSRTRDLFLAILGHDLRAPLATMAMAGELLKRAGLSEERRHEVGAKVDRSATLMRDMIDDLLGYARIQLGSTIPIKLVPFDLREVCETAIENSSAVYPDCRFHFNAQGDLTGMFDGIRLHQLVTNLLLNAAQYRAKNSPVVLSAAGNLNMLTIRVHNHGGVIPEESIETIFAPLTQLAAAGEDDARPRNSLGLGLFVAREIASAHGGTITVKSDEKEGTEFSVLLPRTAPPTQPKQK